MEEEHSCKSCPHIDVETNELHDSPVQRGQQQQKGQQQMQQRRYLQCNKGCGQEIYFANSKSQSGKYIPLSKDTGLPHQCQ